MDCDPEPPKVDLREISLSLDDWARTCDQVLKVLDIQIKKLKYYLGIAHSLDDHEFYQLLFEKKYDEALSLARHNKSLDIDLVYKLKWRNSGVTVASINSVLGNIKDKLWAIAECVQTVPISYEACRRLIEFGLKEANLKLLYKLGHESDDLSTSRTDDKHEGKLSKSQSSRSSSLASQVEDMSDEELQGNIDFDHLNMKQLELCQLRRDLISYEHFLFAYENILGNYKAAQQHFDHVFYDEFRLKCPLEACIDYAHDGDAHAVEIMLNHFTEFLKPHLIPIVSSFPETLPPQKYRNLLPSVRSNEVFYQWTSLVGQIRSGSSDWTSRAPCGSNKKIISAKQADYEEKFYQDETKLSQYRDLERLSSDDLSRWFLERATDMVNRTLLMTNGIQLLRMGQKANVSSLDSLCADLDEFDRIVHDCLTIENIYLSFNEFSSLPMTERLLLMTGDSINKCVDRFNSYVLPYIKRRKLNYTTEELTNLFRIYKTQLAITREELLEELLLSINYQAILNDVDSFLEQHN